jgi:hypothetical protein
LSAFPGDADGGSTPLLAAESREPELPDLTESVGAAGALELLPQEVKISTEKTETTLNNFFIKISGLKI